jgi:hypothetical protein
MIRMPVSSPSTRSSNRPQPPNKEGIEVPGYPATPTPAHISQLENGWIARKDSHQERRAQRTAIINNVSTQPSMNAQAMVDIPARRCQRVSAWCLCMCVCIFIIICLAGTAVGLRLALHIINTRSYHSKSVSSMNLAVTATGSLAARNTPARLAGDVRFVAETWTGGATAATAG